MALQSKLFRGDAKLEAALVSDSAHIVQGAIGSHVSKIQQALNELDGAGLNPDENYGPATASAVLAYKQKRNIINRSYQTRADNIVGKMTMAALDAEMREKERKTEPGPDTDAITATLKKDHPASFAVTQRVAAPTFTIPKAVRPPVIFSPNKQFRFNEFKPEADFHDLLFEVKKGGRVFWIGAAVPKRITDFSRAQMYFTPSTVKPGPNGVPIVLADDKDYQAFTGGWATRMRNFIPMMGVQAAAAEKPVTLLITFMKATAFSALNDDNVFKDRPVQTLNVVMNAIKRHVGAAPFSSVIDKLGVSSFSSGVTPMKLCIGALAPSGLVKEVFNFDGPFLAAHRKELTHVPKGVVSRIFTQHQLSPPPPGWVNLLPDHFRFVTETFGQLQPENIMHQRIGKMMYHQALANSIV
ncbi:peptidoglycan-binding protein [Bradyrhizobium lablabi]|uniref:peptidoglycan-binding domain-containing protein n=1 Tax=Bradyrhizobium lablabi TaxID=722472 RepID=UPI001BA5E022|nr:peptidoglycan-binding protein [Bradyrhizobium lablabi]MBR0696008.1 peptidoglycan-binding protein [Bradyrhizobium lablabi]